MNYQKIHNDIIEKARLYNGSLENGIERHHIIPRSLGGSDAEENIVKLSYRQHYVIHKLLVKLTSGRDRWKMICALKRFAYSSNVIVTSSQYDIIRREHARLCSIYQSGRKATDEAKKNMSIAQKKRYLETPSKLRGYSHTEETREKMRESQGGDKNHQCGKPRTPEERAKISASMKGVPKSAETVEKFRNKVMSEESKRKISESIRKWHEDRKNKLREVE